jgi:hypothetical protein
MGQPAGATPRVADAFPFVPGDDLAARAAVIAESVRREPLVIDRADVRLDGRKRRAACLAAGVEPRYRVERREPSAFISLTVRRRHVSTGQPSMALVLARAEVDNKPSREATAEAPGSRRVA